MTRAEFREMFKEELLMVLSGASASISVGDGWGGQDYMSTINYDKLRMNLCKPPKKGKKKDGK